MQFFLLYCNIKDPNNTLDHNQKVQSLTEKRPIIDIFPISFENVGIMLFEKYPVYDFHMNRACDQWVRFNCSDVKISAEPRLRGGASADLGLPGLAGAWPAGRASI